MLVSNEISKNQYVGDGSATEFAYTFPILDSTHIEVYRQLSTETALEAKLVPAEEYTVEGAGVESGGKVVFKTAPSSGTKLSILRNVPITQLYQYQELDSFPAESHENALAKLTMICQSMDERLDRAIVVSPTDTITPDELRNGIFEASEDAVDSAAAAANSETAAAASETAAAASETAAAASETAAASSAAAAAANETAAASCAAAAANSASAAAASETAAANSAASILELEIEVATLNPGQPASGNYDPITGILHLGIPKGDSGDAAIATPTSPGSVKIGPGITIAPDGTISIDPWNIFPTRLPVAIDGVTFGGSDGRRAIMPGETEAREDWILCDGGSDGKGGTVPDLRGRMIRGASDSVPAGSTGGSETHSHSLSGTVGSTTLSVEQLASHEHAYKGSPSYQRRSGSTDADAAYKPSSQITGTTGGSQPHTHSLSGVSSKSADSLPPYYSGHYVIRV